MDNIKTDVMKAKEYIKARHEELETEYKNLLEEYFGERDSSDLTPRYKIDFQMLRCTGMEIIEDIQAMQCRDEFLLDSEISVIISRLKIIVADCLIKEYALRYELDERDKNDDE